MEGSASKTGGTAKRSISDRDRFVAFAFCWANVLFELNSDKTIHFVGGPTESIIGLGIEDLIGKPFIDFVADSDTMLAEELISVAEKKAGSKMRRLG